jgi:hypothetical protein
LIALGIPVNLDEVRIGDPASTKSLPPLSLKIDEKPGDSNGKQVPPRNGTPDSREPRVPTMDLNRATELTSLTEGESRETALSDIFSP